MAVDDTHLQRSEFEPALDWIARHPGPWFALIWLPVLLVAPIFDAAASGAVLRVGALAILGGVFALTVCLPYRSQPIARWVAELGVVAFTALCVAYFVVWHADQAFVYPLLAINVAMAVRQRWALSLICALTISAAVAAGFERNSLDAALVLAFSTFLAGAANFLVRYLVGVVAELRRSRERLAQAVVAEERLRFSRDLHDLLGHTLSVIVVKAEAVRRLLETDANAAAEHAHDIETIGRDALAEVRDAVTGYRTVSLAAEIAGAGVALAARGIRLDATDVPQGLDALVDSLLGWVVREGTTNVLRHAQAGRCRIALSSDRRGVRVEIEDDGSGGSIDEGSGLTGLRERLDEFGGELTTTTTASGFVLSASIPAFALSGQH